MSRTYEEASRQIQASLQKHLETAQSFEDSENSDDSSEQDANTADCDEIIQRVFGSYDNLSGTDVRTKEALVQSIGSGTCLICICDVKKRDAIWSCEQCHCVMHLQCIQRWAKDSIYQQKRDLENDNSDLRSRPNRQSNRKKDQHVLHWGCPKCRSTYKEFEIPTKYTCYCGKIDDPPFDPWIVPHSCGETCEKNLQPECGHQCLILCHPGPCPPCPKVVKSKCFCGQTAPATKRCFDKDWSCGKPCKKKLSCGQHFCPIPCHEGNICPPCNKKSVQLCSCKKQQKECHCSEPQWQCEDKCGKKLACGYHMCEVICHEGDQCPPCPLSELRHCPCGKTTYKLPCTVATPTCGDTCGKTLACGTHVCVDRCHRGTCGSCLQMIVKQCKCGAKKKEVACAKEYTCDIKCKNVRDCGKHTCNRKCCSGNDCPACDQQCNKTLSCRNHKCNSRCHRGSCYPCTLTQEVSCNCKASRTLVPCGMEKSTKPPKCKQKCKNPPDCHHESRSPHSCHFGPCQPCKQICQKKMACGHVCPKPCHDQVLVKVQDNKKATTPWENKEFHQKTTLVKNLECPECQHPVPVTCLGGHETSDWPCAIAKSAPCGRKCGRSLACENHTCDRDCHKVKNAPNDLQSGSNCRKCESECLKPRPKGCNHACLQPCHPGPCQPCGQMMKIWCNCGITQLYVKCGPWVAASEAEKLVMSCCKDQCPKLISCGHRCTFICHIGDCSDETLCKKKVKLYCPCKRRKQEIACNKAKDFSVKCDEECNQIKQKARAEEEEQKRQEKLEEERLQKEEIEKFEKGGRRRNRRNRRNLSEIQEQGFLQKFKLPIFLFLTTFTSVMLAVYFYK